jgi:hypothetical protein
MCLHRMMWVDVPVLGIVSLIWPGVCFDPDVFFPEEHITEMLAQSKKLPAIRGCEMCYISFCVCQAVCGEIIQLRFL